MYLWYTRIEWCNAASSYEWRQNGGLLDRAFFIWFMHIFLRRVHPFRRSLSPLSFSMRMIIIVICSLLFSNFMYSVRRIGRSGVKVDANCFTCALRASTSGIHLQYIISVQTHRICTALLFLSVCNCKSITISKYLNKLYPC